MARRLRNALRVNVTADYGMRVGLVCEREGCDDPAVVGLNNAWLCVAHFDEGLAAISGVIVRLRGLGSPAVRPQEPPKRGGVGDHPSRRPAGS